MDRLLPANLPLAANLASFLVAAAGVWFAGTRLCVYADEISDRKRIGKAIMGLVFLAAATSLPEIVTTFAAAIDANPALVLNNLFGGIALQTAILAVADRIAARSPLTFYPRKPTPVIEGCFLVLLLCVLQAVAVVGDRPLVFGIGRGALAVIVLYVVAVAMLRKLYSDDSWVPVRVPEEPEDATVSTWRGHVEQIAWGALMVRTVAAVLAILVCGVVLVRTAQAIADQSGLGSSFIGATLLAGTTSLPELSTTIMAVRLRAYTMAISNIFGSNLIMLALLMPADLLYREGTILSAMDRVATLGIISGIAVTTIYVVGLTVRSSRKVLGMGIDSLLVAIVYVLSAVFFYLVR
jgi:cation:H+ antiporter